MKRVLSVGQCVPDQAAIERLLNANFEVTVQKAATADEALAAVQDGGVDLVLVNRKLDAGLLYTSPSPRDATLTRMPSSA